MIVQQTIEEIVKYAYNLIDSIHRKQTVDTSRAILYDNISNTISASIPAFGILTARVLFTPKVSGDPYSEIGASVSRTPYALMAESQMQVSYDPTYISGNNQAWLIKIYNSDFFDSMSVTISASVTSSAQGTVTVQQI